MRNLTPFIKDNPPVSKSAIDKIEFQQNFALPADYKAFLLQHNGGKLYYNSLERSIASDDVQSNGVDFFYDLSENTRFLEGEEYQVLAENKILPIATTLVPGLVGIGLGKLGYGAIYIMEWDFGLTRQADSFTEFLEQIKFDEPTANWQQLDAAFK